MPDEACCPTRPRRGRAPAPAAPAARRRARRPPLVERPAEPRDRVQRLRGDERERPRAVRQRDASRSAPGLDDAGRRGTARGPRRAATARSALRSDARRAAEDRRVDRHAAAARTAATCDQPAALVWPVLTPITSGRLRRAGRSTCAACGRRRSSSVSSRTVVADERACASRSRASFVTSAALEYSPGASSPSGPDEVRVVQAELPPPSRSSASANASKSGATDERERVGGVVRRLDQRAP